MPSTLTWNETRAPDGAGAVVVYEGPGASSVRFWSGLIATITSAAFVKLVFIDHPDNPTWVKAIPLLLLGAGVTLVVQGAPGPRKGRIEIDAREMRVIPSGLVAIEVQVPLVDIDYFSSDAEETDYQVQALGATEVRAEVRFRVYLYRRDGRRHTLAMFGENQAATFMAQRLEGLVERVRSRARVAG